MEDSPLTNSFINKNKLMITPALTTTTKTMKLVIEPPTNSTSESNPLSSSSSSSSTNSSEISTSSSNPLNEDPSVVQIIKHNPLQFINNNAKNGSKLIESLLIKKSPTFDSGNVLSTSTSSNSITKSNSNNLLHATDIENAAKKYRCSAQNNEATCTWKGKLPPKSYKTPVVYSTKVFVGGLPWDITEEDIIKEFGQFGPCRIEWTNKEKFNLLSQQGGKIRNYRSINNLNQANDLKQRSSPGFAYVIYDNEFSVRSLVNNCIEDYANGRDRVEFYFKISTRRVRNKEIQIIPWILADNNFALCPPKELDPKKTVFVGNLHGTMTARDLAHIMNELFGGVVYAGIDIDKLKYPIGSGRVTFANLQNFMQAIRAAFVDIKSSKFSKRIQIDPYLEDVQCCTCFDEKGIYFCRDFQCFNYYCSSCWSKQHSFDAFGVHKPLMRIREDKI